MTENISTPKSCEKPSSESASTHGYASSDCEKMMVKQLGGLQSDERKYRDKRAKTMREVGSQMRGFREIEKVSLRELSRRIGCSAPFLSDMELGHRLYSIEWVRKTFHSLHNAETLP